MQTESLKSVAQLATLLNVKHYVEGGRFKMEALYAATLLRVWGATGHDYVRVEGKSVTEWKIYRGGQYVACVLLDNSNKFAYSYTAI